MLFVRLIEFVCFFSAPRIVNLCLCASPAVGVFLSRQVPRPRYSTFILGGRRRMSHQTHQHCFQLEQWFASRATDFSHSLTISLFLCVGSAAHCCAERSRSRLYHRCLPTACRCVVFSAFCFFHSRFCRHCRHGHGPFW